MFFINILKISKLAVRYMHHAALSSLMYLGTSQKGKSHHMIQKTWAPYFFLYFFTIFIDFRVW